MVFPEYYRPQAAELNEKCGLFGTFYPNIHSAPHTMVGLVGVQHRGQESAGIASSDGTNLYDHKGDGQVFQVFHSDFDFDVLPGGISGGHTRYGTSGGSCHPQPILGQERLFALYHNGNLPDTTKLEEFMDENNISNPGFNDSEMMHAGIEYNIKKGAPLEEAFEKAFPLFTGAWSLLLMDKEKLIAARDPKGIRPLSIGKGHHGYAISSETCAFEPLEISHIRDVNPGEMVIIDHNGMRTHRFAKGEEHLDAFEYVYFARPDSYLQGQPQSVEMARRKMGKIAAIENSDWIKKTDADMVIGMPKSGLSSAKGFADESGIPLETGAIVQNPYMLRTFQNPETLIHTNNGRSVIRDERSDRAQSIRMKLNAIRELVYNKIIIATDDSLVRGNTGISSGAMLKAAGAREVHMVFSSPPVTHPDFYGIDTPMQSKLFANMYPTLEEMAAQMGVESVHFLSLEGMIEATGVPKEMLSLSAFNGEYPIDIGKRKKEVQRISRR